MRLKQSPVRAVETESLGVGQLRADFGADVATSLGALRAIERMERHGLKLVDVKISDSTERERDMLGRQREQIGHIFWGYR